MSVARLLELSVDDDAGQWIPVVSTEFVVGRSRNCDLTLGASKVSRRHCRVYLNDGEYFLEDLGSAGGTWVDNQKISVPVPIVDGLSFRVADATIACRLQAIDPGVIDPDASEARARDDARTEEAAPEDLPTGTVLLWVASSPGRWEPMRGSEWVIGRSSQCDIVLDSKAVSRQHARIKKKEGRFVIEDLGSTSGTRVRGKILKEEGVLDGGADVAAGDTPFVVEIRRTNEGPPEDAGQSPFLLDIATLQMHPLAARKLSASSDKDADLSDPDIEGRVVFELFPKEGRWVGLLKNEGEKDSVLETVEDGEVFALGSKRLRLVLPRVPPQVEKQPKPAIKVSYRPGEWVTIDKDEFVIGRGKKCDLVVNSPSVSRLHCAVSLESGQFLIKDLGGAGGVWIGDRLLDTPEPVPLDEPVRIGDRYLSFAPLTEDERRT